LHSRETLSHSHTYISKYQNLKTCFCKNIKTNLHKAQISHNIPPCFYCFTITASNNRTNCVGNTIHKTLKTCLGECFGRMFERMFGRYFGEMFGRCLGDILGKCSGECLEKCSGDVWGMFWRMFGRMLGRMFGCFNVCSILNKITLCSQTYYSTFQQQFLQKSQA